MEHAASLDKGGISVEHSEKLCIPLEYTAAMIEDEYKKNVARAIRLSTILDILGDTYDLDHLRDLVEADRDGRCVVLPCKIGTPVYRILWHCGCAALDDESYKYVGFPVPFTFDMINQFGKSVFLTREEAEEAMKEREEDEG